MTGTTQAFFTQKRNEFQQVVEQAQAAAAKAQVANQALEILSKSYLQSAEAQADIDALISLHQQVS